MPKSRLLVPLLFLVVVVLAFSSPSQSPLVYGPPQGGGSSSATTTAIHGVVTLTVNYTLHGGVPPNNAPPVFNYFDQNGQRQSVQLQTSPTQIQVGLGTPWSVNPIPSTSPDEQWGVSNAQEAGNATQDQLLDFQYYHQFKLSAFYTVLYGGSLPFLPPILVLYQGGERAAPIQLTTQPVSYWADLGTSWSADPLLAGSSNAVRWLATNRTGQVMNAGSVSVVYSRQFPLNMTVTPLGSGSISAFNVTADGWANATSTVSIHATQASGYTFEGWSCSGQGCYNGTESSADVVMDGPIVETAQFTPIVAIAVQVLGSDVPQYVAVDNGQPTVFPPTFEWAPNTNHTLTAEENVSCGSFLSINFCMYKFYGWSVDGVQHSEKTLNVKADKTKTITVTYEKNYFNPLEFAIIGALLLVVVLLLVFRRRRRPERPKPAPNLPSPPSGLAYKVGFLSDLGRNRSNNEDAILAMESLTAFGSKSNSAILSAVADGVGGSQKGEVASKLTLTTLAAHVSPSLVDSEGKDRMKTLTAAVEAANEQVVKYGMAHRESEGLASTLVVSLIEGNAAYIANVGDSRAYLVNRGGIKQLTKDHSQVQELVDAGKLTSDQSRHSVGRNVITRAIGASTNVQVDTYSVSLSPGDRLLMCTDGLWEPVEDAEIHKLVMQSTDPQAACESLVALANERGGKDNLSVIIVELKLASEQKQVT